MTIDLGLYEYVFQGNILPPCRNAEEFVNLSPQRQPSRDPKSERAQPSEDPCGLRYLASEVEVAQWELTQAIRGMQEAEEEGSRFPPSSRRAGAPVSRAQLEVLKKTYGLRGECNSDPALRAPISSTDPRLVAPSVPSSYSMELFLPIDRQATPKSLFSMQNLPSGVEGTAATKARGKQKLEQAMRDLHEAAKYFPDAKEAERDIYRLALLNLGVDPSIIEEAQQASQDNKDFERRQEKLNNLLLSQRARTRISQAEWGAAAAYSQLKVIASASGVSYETLVEDLHKEIHEQKLRDRAVPPDPPYESYEPGASFKQDLELAYEYFERLMLSKEWEAELAIKKAALHYEMSADSLKAYVLELRQWAWDDRTEFQHYLEWWFGDLLDHWRQMTHKERTWAVVISAAGGSILGLLGGVSF